MSAAGVPLQLLHEGEGNPITVELKNGEIYRGHLEAAEDNMNVQLTGVTHRARDGRVSKLEHVYLRGAQVRFIVLPDMLKAAPVFKRVQQVADAKSKEWMDGPPTKGKGAKGKGPKKSVYGGRK